MATKKIEIVDIKDARNNKCPNKVITFKSNFKLIGLLKRLAEIYHDHAGRFDIFIDEGSKNSYSRISYSPAFSIKYCKGRLDRDKDFEYYITIKYRSYNINEVHCIETKYNGLLFVDFRIYIENID